MVPVADILVAQVGPVEDFLQDQVEAFPRGGLARQDLVAGTRVRDTRADLEVLALVGHILGVQVAQVSVSSITNKILIILE